MSSPTPRCTGLFIPIEILELDLSPTEHMLLAWIDGLYSKDHGGCFASNEWFSNKLRLKENTVKILISKLVGLGLVERVSFDGRQRILRACKENWYKNQSQSTAEVDLNQPQGLKKINPCGSLKSTPPIYRDKSLDKSIYPPIPQKGEPPDGGKNEVLVSHGSHVKLKAVDLKTLEDKHGAKKVADFIERVNDYCASKGKTYKDWAAAIRTFIRNDDAKNPESPTFDTNAALLRRKNSKLATPGDFDKETYRRKRVHELD